MYEMLLFALGVMIVLLFLHLIFYNDPNRYDYRNCCGRAKRRKWYVYYMGFDWYIQNQYDYFGYYICMYNGRSNTDILYSWNFTNGSTHFELKKGGKIPPFSINA